MAILANAPHLECGEAAPRSDEGLAISSIANLRATCMLTWRGEREVLEVSTPANQKATGTMTASLVAQEPKGNQ